MRWVMHNLIIEGTTNDASLTSRWNHSFSPLDTTDAPADLLFDIVLVDEVPDPPAKKADFTYDKIIAYYLRGQTKLIHLPEIGQLLVDVEAGLTHGAVVPACLEGYGLLEDIIALGLSPHLRRVGYFMIHAFAAALRGRYVLIVGDSGTGKTTTGISLLQHGWQLLSNDSPIIASGGRVLRYPGLLAAYPDTWMRFRSTRHLVGDISDPDRKIEVAAETVWSNIWCDEAHSGIILFPQIGNTFQHVLHRLSPAETLGRLSPHSMESWDKSSLEKHLAALEQLVDKTPAYMLALGRDMDLIPGLLEETLKAGR